MAEPGKVLLKIANDAKYDINSADFAQFMDQQDPIKHFRHKFYYPTKKDLRLCTKDDEECVYLCGNSLGLMPKVARSYMEIQLDQWAKLAVHSHFEGMLPAASCDQPGKKMTAELVGAEEEEVVLMNGLTVNMHLFLLAFYRPSLKGRYKILFESQAFPSDRFALKSLVELMDLDPEDALIELEPRSGEHTIRSSDILDTIQRHKDTLSVCFFSGVQYFTGQKFDMPLITAAAQKAGAIIGFDLAHAIGNVKLALHEWGVDFAVWCSYKYLNSGAGGLAGAFLHSRHLHNEPKHLHGWWSNKNETRFLMSHDVDLAAGAESFRLSNPPPWLACLNFASLEIFHEAGMDSLTRKQFLLTGYLEYLIREKCNGTLEIITPDDPEQRGNQLSVIPTMDAATLHKSLLSHGVVCDVRKPNVIRISPAPLYNSFMDVWKATEALKTCLNN